MKHITTLIALALVLGSLAPLTAQNKMTAKEKRTQTRQERKIAQQKVKEELYQDAVRALENNTFVLEANRLICKCQFNQKFHFHGKQKSHGASKF